MREVRKKLCSKCEREISLSNFSLHSLKCKGKVVKTTTICRFCNKEFNSQGARAGHEYRSHTGRHLQGINAAKGRLIQAGLPKKKFNHSAEFKARQSVIAKERNLGGQFCGKHFWYEKDGQLIHMHSSYELTVAGELDKNNIEWLRPSAPVFWKDSRGIIHRYYADFFLPKYGVFLDPKNDYLISKDQEKITEVKKQIYLLILTDQELSWNSIRKLVEGPPAEEQSLINSSAPD